MMLLIFTLLLGEGGEKVLLHFIQDSPGDFVPLDNISSALGISAKVKAGQKPMVRPTSSPWTDFFIRSF